MLTIPHKFHSHESWDENKGWKNLLNNLRLILQPLICFNLIKQELKVFPIPQLSLGFPRLISIMNQFDCLGLLNELLNDFYFPLPRVTEESYTRPIDLEHYPNVYFGRSMQREIW